MTKVLAIFVVAVLVLGLIFFAIKTEVAPSIVQKSTSVGSSVGSTTVDVATGTITATAP